MAASANHDRDADGTPVFVKSIPLTGAELANPGSTRNHYGLPPNFQYGVGSAGFGAYRELAAHMATTQWALDGTNEHFPLLHSRVLPLPEEGRRMARRVASATSM